MNDPTTGGPATADAETPTKPIAVTDSAELDDCLARFDAVLVEFYTKGCTLCQSIEPVLGTVARVADVAVVTVNPREDLSLVDRYDVRSVPTLVLHRGGEPVGRLAEGFQGAAEILSFVGEHAPDRVPA